MDLTGYHARSRISGGLMQAHYDPKRKLHSRPSVSLATRATLLLLFIVALWTGIRRATIHSAPEPSKAAPSNAAAGKAATGEAAAAAGLVPPTVAVAASRSEALMQARIERAMRLTPSYRGPGKIETFPHFGNANRLLLATHGRLMWYRYDTDQLHVLHEGEGVYYGAFPGAERGVLGEPTSLWVVSRPHNWHPTSSKEWLLHLDLESGRELGRVQIGSRFTHDAVRRRDRVYVCSTGDGRVLELSFPNMTQVRELPLFTLREHVNTLAPGVDGKLWGVLHNLGNSSLVQVDLESGKEVKRLPGIGLKAHGLVFWSKFILTLDSDGGALAQVDPQTGAVDRLWQMSDSGRFLKGLCVVDDVAFFGIAPRTQRGRRNDPALSCELAAFDLRSRLLLWRRQLPTRGLLNLVAAPHLVVESTTYSVNTHDLISYRGTKAFAEALEAVQKWQLQQEHEAQGAQQAQQAHAARVGGQHAGQAEQHTQQVQAGVAAEALQQQHAAAHSGGAGGQAQAAGTRAPVVQQQQQGQHGVAGQGEHLQQQQQQQQGATGQAQQQQQQQQQALRQEGNVRRALTEVEALPPNDPLAKYPPTLDTVRWSSGLPRLLLSAKGRLHGLAAGAQLQLFRADVAGLKAELAAMPDSDWDEAVQRVSNAWIEGRTGVLAKFKPGTRTIMLVFSDQDGGGVYRFPWYERFRQWVEPWLLQILGPADLDKVMRLQLAVMPPGSQIQPHLDTGGYSAVGHRIHVVVQSNPGVRFQVCQSPEGAQAAGDEGGGALPCLPLHVEEGLVFELNNRLRHDVVNSGTQPRIHLVLDVAETPRTPRQLRVGEVCRYVDGRVVCPEVQHGLGSEDALR